MNAFIWAMLASVVWGFVPILEKLGLKDVKPMSGLFYRCAGVAIGLILLSIVLVKPAEIKAVGIRSACLLMLAGFLASFVAQIFFYNGLKLGEVSRIVPISASYPLMTFLLGVWLLGESWSFVKLGGVVLIVAGMWLLRIG